ncbi:LacI family transcription regulator [Caballeronia hypogeia]|uniref:LacI family transcription regulator n=1 Tax=Caballeronia hypogeia TaxID=1777140 RepID=A0A158DAR6_9BURK|nr:LacI family DNA-binding transcriptional regulator [Caballeronia hypogeia]SAK90897.1 LacI family transcription regulator [Caballeronia hypogeia]
MSDTVRPREEVSIADVAERAGVSVATVSRVLNGHTNVREVTREKVLQAVASSGYRINELARNLRTAESRLLLTMVPDFGNPFYAAIVRGIDTVARQNGYFMLLCDTGADPLRERSYFDLLRGRRADGAICLDPAAVQKALAEEASTLPWVACCEFDPAAGVPYVGIDNHLAAGDVVRYLVAKGHRRIALINSGQGYLYGRQRLAGYRDALSDAGLHANPAWQIELDSLDYEAGARATAQLIALGDVRPSAIFAVSDTLAIGVMNGVRNAGLRVPEDVAVVGFDDIAVAAHVDPPLTTVLQPMQRLGETAAELLLKRLRDPRVEVPGVLLPHRLIERRSA